MTRVNVQIELPDHMAEAAKEAGLLSSAALRQMIEAGVRRKAADRIRQGAERGQASGIKPLSLDELQEIVRSVRKSGN